MQNPVCVHGDGDAPRVAGIGSDNPAAVAREGVGDLLLREGSSGVVSPRLPSISQPRPLGREQRRGRGCNGPPRGEPQVTVRFYPQAIFSNQLLRKDNREIVPNTS